jgi:hypothetical protein
VTRDARVPVANLGHPPLALEATTHSVVNALIKGKIKAFQVGFR